MWARSFCRCGEWYSYPYISIECDTVDLNFMNIEEYSPDLQEKINEYMAKM